VQFWRKWALVSVDWKLRKEVFGVPDRRILNQIAKGQSGIVRVSNLELSSGTIQSLAEK
jgi:hypothetical protein